MRRIFSLALIGSLSLSSFSAVYAQDMATGSLNAAPNENAVASAASTNKGEYTEVACTTDPVFAQNSCNQCFTGGSVKIGEKKTDLFDNWSNTTAGTLVAYKNEQKIPEMVSFDSKWVPASADESKMWKNTSDVIWLPGTDSKGDSFMLLAGEKKKFLQTDLGAGFTLESSNRKNGEIAGLLKFPVVYRTLDMNTAVASTEATTHYECVTYTLDKPAEVTPPKPTPKKPTPPAVTKTKTGPAETLVLIVVAFFIAFGLMISLRKRSQ